jgi:hypothetical protein
VVFTPSRVGWALMALMLVACAEPTGSAQGRVVPGAELEGVEITLLGPVTRATQTDAEGQWLIRELPPGDYAVVAVAPDTLEQRLTATLEVRERILSDTDPLTFTPVGKISGVATNPAGISVSVLMIGGSGAAQTSSDGSFVLSNVPAGKRDLLAWAPGFEPARAVGIEVHRGATTAIPPLSLRPLEGGGAPGKGTLKGRASLPGTDDHSGIIVEVVGTARSTITAADGSFTLGDLPSGIIALSLHTPWASAQLSRVLVVPGSAGFIVDGGLFDLDRHPIGLRRGSRIGDEPMTQLVGSPDGQWACLVQTVAPHAAFLFGPDGHSHLITKDSFQSSLGFFSGQNPAFWFTAYDPTSEYVLSRTSLETAVTVPFARGRFNQAPRSFAATGLGAAWIVSGRVSLRASELAPTISLPGHAGIVVSLGDETVLATIEDSLEQLRLDGTLVDTFKVPLAADWLVLSPDRRYAVLGTGGLANTAYGPTNVLVDRITRTSSTLPAVCNYPLFAPSSDALLCSTMLHRFAPDGTITSQPVLNETAQWLPAGRLAVFNGTTLRVISPGESDVLLSGVSREALPLRARADGSRVKLVANVDDVTGLGQALELSLPEGKVTVLADGILATPFVATDTWTVFGRPRSVGSDLELVFLPESGLESTIARSVRRYSSGLSVSKGGTFIAVRRFIAGRGTESIIFDTRDGSIFALSSVSSSYESWVDDHRFLQATNAVPPFSDARGTFLVELP